MLAPIGDPWAAPPSNIDHRVLLLVEKAQKLNVPADRLKTYARVLIAAEEVLAQRERMEQFAPDQAALAAASEHGMYTNDPKEARAAYNAARRAQQEVHASASACAKRLAKLEELLKAKHKSLQVDVASQFPIEKIGAATKVIEAFAAATMITPKNLADVKTIKSELSLTVAGHTLTWWRQLPGAKGRWVEMYDLAQCWRLTEAKDLSTFQRWARKFKPTNDLSGRSYILGCPPWALL